MNETDVSKVPNSQLHSLLIGEQIVPKIKCTGEFYFFFYIFSLACDEPATWQLENSNVTYCDAHKQQMPSFVPFKALDTSMRTILANCSANHSHGLANVFCKKCKMSLCDKCAFGHESHGAKDIFEMHLEIGKQVAERMCILEKQTVQNKPVLKEARMLIKSIQEV